MHLFFFWPQISIVPLWAIKHTILVYRMYISQLLEDQSNTSKRSSDLEGTIQQISIKTELPKKQIAY